MGNIKVLPQHVANKIAAGEIVERPASIIKELIENSLDASSTNIEIIVKNGGISYIRISDNGSGMDRSDLELCIERHATSKISCIGDIFSITSFGFRGEALPSIASVSRMKILTRQKESPTAFELNITAGESSPVTESACSEGTIIEIEDLFFNTPARRKFLKKEQTELGYIEETFLNLAMSNFAVGFKLYDDQKLIYDLPSASNFLERIAKIKNPAFCNELVEINEKIDDKNSFHGYIGMPSLVRSNRLDQHFFINGRSIKHPGFNFVLSTAYQGIISSDKFPIAFIFFDLDLKQVDVNVHPTKKEVRISNEKLLKTRLLNTVKGKLSSSDIFKRITFTSDIKSIVQEINQMTNQAKERLEIRDRAFDPANTFNKQVEGATNTQMLQNFNNTQVDSPAKDFFRQNDVAFDDITLIGQIKSSLILAETSDSLVIIDQHAAHERILYEEILENFQNKQNVQSQSIIPCTIELNYKQAALFEEYKSILNELGFSINDFGNNTYSIDAVPHYFKTPDVAGLVLDCIDKLEAESIGTDIETKKQKVASALACKRRSVKASTKLEPEQMKAILNSLAKTKEPYRCPHGRPTIVQLQFQSLLKQFGK